MNKLILYVMAGLMLASCASTVDRLRRVGKDPEFASIELPPAEEDEEEIELHEARKEAQHAHMQKTNSLWHPGSTKFFRDNRAWRVGDIIKVVVKIQDTASLNNSTQQKRNGQDSLGVPNLFGKETALATVFSPKGVPASLVNANSSRTQTGSGTISRTETVQTSVAAAVTKVLPNGNLVIQGSQEIRVNSELREIKIAGIIRPKDIDSSNSIDTSQIAEARIAYGGRGVVSDVQQPRVGSQVLDIIAPF